MKLHGKLLICARNESVELDGIMNIHPGLQHTEVDQWLEQPTRLMTQIRVSYLGGDSWKPVSLLPQFFGTEMELITHKSLAHLQLAQVWDQLEREFPSPRFHNRPLACGVTDNGNACTERTRSPCPLSSLNISWGSVLGTP